MLPKFESLMDKEMAIADLCLVILTLIAMVWFYNWATEGTKATVKKSGFTPAPPAVPVAPPSYDTYDQ